MRVAINCLRLETSFVGGLNTFTRGVLQGFANTANGHQFRIYVSSRQSGIPAMFRNRENFEVIVVDEWAQFLRKMLCRTALFSFNERIYEATSNYIFRGICESMERNVDLVYTPCTVLQYFNGRRPSVLSMHDIQHVHFPEFFIWPRRLSRRVTYGLSASHARFLQASSEFSKRDFLQHFRCISPEQVAVIPEGVHIKDFDTPVDIGRLLDKYAIPERFILYPAQLWLHKNHITLLQALRQIESQKGLKIPLVLTGGKYSSASKVLSYIADQSMEYVHYLGKIPFTDLVGLYRQAAFLVMPSLHESNSLPVLEAAAAGTPIIASRIPPNEEMEGVFQLNLFDPLNADDLARLILQMWEDESAGTAQAAYNRKSVTLYSWDNAAKQYLQLFEKALNGTAVRASSIATGTALFSR